MADVSNYLVSAGSLVGLVFLYLLNKFKPEGVKSFVKALNDFKLEMVQRMTAVESKQQIYGDFMKQQITELLHSPHTPEIDRLLEKLKNKTIIQDEICELRDKIKSMMLEMDRSDSRFGYAAQLLQILEMEIPNWNVR